MMAECSKNLSVRSLTSPRAFLSLSFEIGNPRVAHAGFELAIEHRMLPTHDLLPLTGWDYNPVPSCQTQGLLILYSSPEVEAAWGSARVWQRLHISIRVMMKNGKGVSFNNTVNTSCGLGGYVG